MTHLSHHLQTISGLSSDGDKESYLKNLPEETQQEFRDMARLAYSPQTFGIKGKIPKESELSYTETPIYTNTTEVFSYLTSKGEFTTKKDREELIQYMNLSSPENNDILRRILKRNLDCGIAAKTVNKIYPGTVFIPPYMRASLLVEKNKHKVKFPCIAQTKFDGKFVNLLVQDTDGCSIVHARSRDWEDMDKVIPSNIYSIFDAIRLMGESNVSGYVIHGECLVLDDNGKALPREIGNGYLNRDVVERDRIVFKVWDIIPEEDFMNGFCAIPYSDRLEFLTKLVDSANELNPLFPMMVVDSVIAESPEQINQIYRDHRANGEEGIMIKNFDMKWKFHTSPDMFKLKHQVDCEMIVTGVTIGEDNKYEGMVTSLDIESECGRVSCSVGSGLTDKQRADVEFWENMVSSGGIVTVRYNDVTTNQSRPGIYSLYLPRLVETRTDKTEADSLDLILEQLEMDVF